MTSTYMFGLLLSTLISCSLTNTSSTIITKPRSLALRLIHRHSISAPLRSSKLSFSNQMSGDDLKAPVFPMEDSSIFLVNISIGEPPVPQLMALDTGSRLIWIQCNQCGERCSGNVFDPQRSSTFSALSGDSPQCSRTLFAYQQHSLCPYWTSYGDMSRSSGILAKETFTFLTSTGGSVEVPDVVFGCAIETTGSARDLNGILALEAPNEYCLAARSGNKFSYCIGNISDTGYMYNQLILGDGAVLEGDSTPMLVKDQHYVVSLEGISVGDKQLLLDPEDFYYNVVIDSGSTYTELRQSAYEPLVAEVKNLMSSTLKAVYLRNAKSQLCYVGNLERDLKGFPVVTLHLAEGTDIEMDVEAMFQRTKDGSAFCLAVVQARQNIIGVKAQQYHNVGFDLDAKRISFQRIDCQLLQD